MPRAEELHKLKHEQEKLVSELNHGRQGKGLDPADRNEAIQRIIQLDQKIKELESKDPSIAQKERDLELLKGSLEKAIQPGNREAITQQIKELQNEINVSRSARPEPLSVPSAVPRMSDTEIQIASHQQVIIQLGQKLTEQHDKLNRLHQESPSKGNSLAKEGVTSRIQEIQGQIKSHTQEITQLQRPEPRSHAPTYPPPPVPSQSPRSNTAPSRPEPPPRTMKSAAQNIDQQIASTFQKAEDRDTSKAPASREPRPLPKPPRAPTLEQTQEHQLPPGGPGGGKGGRG